MTTEIIVPRLGESVTEATVAKWLKNVGETIEADQPLVELETDKVTLEVNASTSGVLSEIKAQTGETVAVGAILGLISKTAAVKAAIKPQVKPTSEQPPAFPAARKIANEQAVDLHSISGTGKGGRVTKGDVLEYMAAGGSHPKVETPTISSLRKRAAQEQRVHMTRLRQRIAQRLKEAQNTAAMLTTFNEVDMSGIVALRNQHKETFEKKHGVKLGFMSFFVHAVVSALKEIPAVNAEIEGADVIYKNYYDIGVAVGTEQGLVVPVLRDADKLGFAEIEKAIAAFGLKAREGKLSMEELTGGTFTISNGGVYGSLLSTPILNPPQSGILGMHRIQDRPVVVAGKIEIRPMMYLALSYDHRIVDGREAVTFLVKVKEMLEKAQIGVL